MHRVFLGVHTMPFTVPVNNDAHGNAIVCQFRARPPADARSSDDHYTIPPMTMCFSRPSAHTTDPTILDVFACAKIVAKDDVFRGVSVDDVRGSDARRTGESRSRITLAVRGKINIMCDAEQLAKIGVGSGVGFEPDKQILFDGFAGTPVCALVSKLETDPRCIGVLVSKGDRRHRVNCAAVLLK